MTFVGGVAGLAAWMLIEIVPDHLENPHLLVTVVAAVAGFFAVMLAIAGPVSVAKACLGAALLSLPAALLLGWASLRFEASEAFYGSGFSLSAWAALLFVGAPFVSLWLWDRHNWSSYLDLFEAAWTIVVRYAAAWLFVGVFWAVLFLCDALLSLVSVNWIEDLIEIDGVPFVLTGAVFGLALRVVYEMRDYLSPYLILHLLRLLLPVLLVVMVIFVLALPMSDPETLFGGLSPAGTVMAVALGGICLVSVALDKSDADAVRANWMQLATRLLCLLLPVLSALALYGIWLRVSAYGWTPARLAATTAAIVILLYALHYAASVLRGGEWMARIRRGNLVMAGVVMAVAALWLSPILNAEAISARSQEARYLNGAATSSELAVWEMQKDWGKAGKRALERLAALEGAQHADLRQRIDQASLSDNFYEFEQLGSDEGRGANIEALTKMIRVVPTGTELPAGALNNLPDYRLEDWLQACGKSQEFGCILLLGQFTTGSDEQSGLLFRTGYNGGFEAVSVWLQDDNLVAGDFVRDPESQDALELSEADIARLLAGEFRIAPSSRQSLWLGDLELHPEN